RKRKTNVVNTFSIPGMFPGHLHQGIAPLGTGKAQQKQPTSHFAPLSQEHTAPVMPKKSANSQRSATTRRVVAVKNPKLSQHEPLQPQQAKPGWAARFSARLKELTNRTLLFLRLSGDVILQDLHLYSPKLTEDAPFQ